MLLGIQIFGVLFGLFMVYYSFLHYKRKEFQTGELVIWLIVWIAFILLSLFPSSLDFLIRDVLNMNRRMDFFIIIGFMFLVGLGFYTYSVVRKNQKKLEDIVRRLAVEKK